MRSHNKDQEYFAYARLSSGIWGDIVNETTYKNSLVEYVTSKELMVSFDHEKLGIVQICIPIVKDESHLFRSGISVDLICQHYSNDEKTYEVSVRSDNIKKWETQDPLMKKIEDEVDKNLPKKPDNWEDQKQIQDYIDRWNKLLYR